MPSTSGSSSFHVGGTESEEMSSEDGDVILVGSSSPETSCVPMETEEEDEVIVISSDTDSDVESVVEVFSMVSCCLVCKYVITVIIKIRIYIPYT